MPNAIGDRPGVEPLGMRRLGFADFEAERLFRIRHGQSPAFPVAISERQQRAVGGPADPSMHAGAVHAEPSLKAEPLVAQREGGGRQTTAVEPDRLFARPLAVDNRKGFGTGAFFLVHLVAQGPLARRQIGDCGRGIDLLEGEIADQSRLPQQAIAMLKPRIVGAAAGRFRGDGGDGRTQQRQRE